jgi:PAS domain S-box-containing protein
VATEFRHLFELHPLPTYVFEDATGRILAANAAAIDQYGYSRDQFLQLTIYDIRPPEDVASVRASVEAHSADARFQAVRRHQRATGDVFDVEVCSQPVSFAERAAHLVVATDITDRETVQRRLAEAHEQLRRVSSRARARREEDRTRIARELHDQLGQALAGIKIDLHWLHTHVGDRSAEDEFAGKIAAMDRLLDDTIWRVRRLSSELRPPVLDKLGLLSAIEWQAQEFSARTGIRTRVRSQVASIDLDRGRATSVFRIFQETLTNIATHAAASSATITISLKGSTLLVAISDDGVGMRPEHITNRRSLGLIGMRERASLLGGTVDIRPNRPRGTRVVIAVPLQERRETPREDWA